LQIAELEQGNKETRSKFFVHFIHGRFVLYVGT
jgi:hypothetical protein